MSKETRGLLEELRKLALVSNEALRDAVDANDDGRIDLRDVLAMAENKDLKDRFERLLDQTKRKQVLSAISEVLDAQQALVAGRSLFDLTDEELDRYSSLGQTRRMLFTMARKIESDRNAFLSWFSDHAIPVILDVLKTVIPLLVV